MPIPTQVLSQEKEARTLLVQRPFGVVGLITPWNYPIGTAAVKLAPALLAGNSIILKPSPFAPLSPLLLGRILRKCLPAGVLNTISGGDELGALIALHPGIRKISLTGSTATGQSVLRETAAELKSVTLELGGNDPAIVLPDAHPREIAKPILDAAWRNAGQVCSAIKRVYVHHSLYQRLVAALRDAAENYVVGDGMAPGTTMGPISTRCQLNRVTDLFELAEACGAATHRAQRQLPAEGFFFSPTIVTGIDRDHPLVTAEQFGPLLPILPFRTIDEAITLANDTNYGLSASVWTSNPVVGYDVACQMECGRVGINGHKRASVSAPFGGFKHSGLGRELGVWGLLAMSESQVVNIFN